MIREEKIRANRNRTLIVSDDEAPMLRENIIDQNDVIGTMSFVDKLIHGDVLKVIDYIPDAFADLIIIDPPYNLSKVFNSSKFSAMTDDKYAEYMRSWFNKICRKLKPNGSLYMCGDWRCSAIQKQIIEEELYILNRITWQREKGRGAKSNWKNAMEDIWFAVKNEKEYYFNVESVKMKRRVIAPYKDKGIPKDWEETQDGKFRITFPSNFWDDISIPFWSMPENTDHPTQKPEKLIAKLILASSKPGDVIFDPFAGSGTTCVVAKKLNRHYLGIEIDDEYCLWGAKRLLNARSDSDIQGYSGGYFWERNTLNLQIKNQNQSKSKEPNTLFNKP